MAKTPVVKITFIGDSTNAQKSMKDLAGATGQAQVSTEGFGKEFLKLGAAFGLGALSIEGAAAALKTGAKAIFDYNVGVDQSTKRILGLTKSQEAVAAATALANKEQDAGRAAYAATLDALAALTPLSQRYNLNLEEVLHTTELLAASDPVQGFEGAKIALQEALSGDFTSLARRFELPKNAIQELKDQGVPNLQIVQKVLEQLGFDQQYLDTANTSTAKSLEILKGRLAEFFGEANKPVIEALGKAIGDLNDKLKSPGWSVYAGEYKNFMRLVVDSLTDWKALSGVGEQLTIFLEQRLQQQVQYLIDLSLLGQHAIAAALGKNDVFDEFLKAHHPIQQLLDGWKASSAGQQAELDAWFKANFADPIKKAATGDSPGTKAISPAAMQGYGADVVNNFLKGLTSDQVESFSGLSDTIGKLFGDSFKDDKGAVQQATSALAQALQDIARTGDITETTMAGLSAIYGDQADEVATLVRHTYLLDAAHTNAAAAADQAAQAEKDLADAQRRASDDIKLYQDALDAATEAQKRHKQEADDLVSSIEAQINAIQAEVAAAAKAGEHTLDGLQQGLDDLQQAESQHAAASQTAVAAAQTSYEQAQTRRQQLQGVLQAALNGELETYIRINDIKDETILKIAAQYQAEIDGQRRAKEGADDKVTALTRAAHKEDRDALHNIDELRRGGHEKEARAAEKALALRQKERAAALQLAQADAAVAGDEFDEKAAQLAQEGKTVDEQAGKEEKAAAANLTAVQAQAKAQADADKAAIQAQQDRIKQVQAQQKAEKERYDDQIDNLNGEIAKAKANAKDQDKIDQDRVDWAQQLLDKTKDYWDALTTGLKDTAQGLKDQAAAMKSIADDAERAQKAEEKRYQLYKDNQPGSPTGPPVVTPPGQTPTSPYDETQPYVPPPPSLPPATTPPGGTSALAGNPTSDAWLQDFGARGWGPALGGGASPPPGYHVEKNRVGEWWVRDGYTINAGGTGIAPVPSGTPPPSTGGPGGLSRVNSPLGGGESASVSPAFLRASGAGGQPAADGAGTVVFQAIFPNVTDLGDPAQRATMFRDMEREWHQRVRAGRVKRDMVGA